MGYMMPAAERPGTPVAERDLKRPPDTPLPSTHWLTAALDNLLQAGTGSHPLQVLIRAENLHTSSYQTEIVTCAVAGSEVRLFCKYSGDREFDRMVRRLSRGQRGGVRYEIEIYRSVLRGLDLPTPVFHGALEVHDQKRTCLVLDFEDEACKVTKVGRDVGVLQAARRLGHLHAEFEDNTPWSSIHRYDTEYFAQWAALATERARQLGLESPWLADLASRYEQTVECLLESPTLVHGEFYPKNVLASNGSIIFLDWETAAVAGGEVDLASLIEGWNPAVAEDIVREYGRARWPAGSPGDLSMRIEVAQTYWYLRWLARASATKNAVSRIDSLDGIARKWGLA